MSLTKVAPNELLELPTDWRVTLSVAAAKLAVFLPIWSYALWQFDDPRIVTHDPFVFNLRLAFFLYLLEILWGLYLGRTVPVLEPHQAWHRARQDALTTAGQTLIYTPVGCVVRWGIVAGVTALLIQLPSPTAWTTAPAAFLPTLAIAAALRWNAGKAAAVGMPTGTVRGTHIGTYAEAVAKAAALRRRSS